MLAVCRDLLDGAMATTAPRAPNDQASLVDSFRRLTAWMKANGAPLLAENLAPGAKPVSLVKLEGKLGFKVPPGLRALWLMHDGQRKALNGFVGPLQLLPVAWVLNERVRTAKVLAKVRVLPHAVTKAAGLTKDEVQSDAWLPIAARDDASLLVHATTGRVFAASLAQDAEPPLQLIAESVPKWLAAYADSVEAGEFEVAPGFGDYHLSPAGEGEDDGEDDEGAEEE
jgi:cell wall assembly regulator SMI1